MISEDGRGMQIKMSYLAGEVERSTLGHLQDDGGLLVPGSLERCDDGGGRGHIDGWNGEFLLLGIIEQGEDIVGDNDALFAGEYVFGHIGMD